MTLLGIFTAMMVNNHRINHLDRRIDNTRELLRAESKAEFARVDAHFTQVDAHFAALEAKLDRYHETVLRIRPTWKAAYDN